MEVTDSLICKSKELRPATESKIGLFSVRHTPTTMAGKMFMVVVIFQKSNEV